MAASRQKETRETIYLQALLVWSDLSKVDATRFVEHGTIAEEIKQKPRLSKEVWEKVAEIQANGGHCVFNLKGS